MKTLKFFTLFVFTLLAVSRLNAQTPVPNGDFELWDNFSGYSDPQQWDSPNATFMAIPIFGKAVVFKSTDHHGGSYSAKLMTQHIAFPGAPFDSPGFITLGHLSIDILTQTYSVDGGVPISDQPTHFMGWYKFTPVGGDSCTMGIILYKTNSGVRDTIAGGYFSTTAAAADWTHFSAWINYDTVCNPDTMNIMAVSSAQTDMHVGTTLWVDDFYLDYTVGYDKQDPAAGIFVYQDKETDRLIVACEFPAEQEVVSRLYDMTGRQVAMQGPARMGNGKMILPYSNLKQGVYILAVQHDGKTFTKKFMLGF